MKKIAIALVTFGLASVSATSAFAQDYEGGYMAAPVRAPRGAFEIGLGTAYTQGFGSISGNTGRVQDIANAGIGFGLDLSSRVSPGFAIGLTGNYQEYKADNRLPEGTNTRGVTAGIKADFHIAPYQRVDPWVSVGTGYRMQWIVPDGPGNNTMLHGFELGKVQLGADIRASDSVAIGPFIGADLNMFVWRNPEGAVGNIELSDKRVNTFIFAGLQGRFDVGGARDMKLQPVTASR